MFHQPVWAYCPHIQQTITGKQHKGKRFQCYIRRASPTHIRTAPGTKITGLHVGWTLTWSYDSTVCFVFSSLDIVEVSVRRSLLQPINMIGWFGQYSRISGCHWKTERPRHYRTVFATTGIPGKNTLKQ